MNNNVTMSRNTHPRHNFAPGDLALKDGATLALDAFDRGSALLDLTHQCLRWCSPGFEAHCCATHESPVAELEQRLPGLQAAMNALAGAHGDGQRWDGTPGKPSRRQPSAAIEMRSGPNSKVVQWRPQPGSMDVQATIVRHGLVALRLMDEPGDDEERERAARRHLEDREKLLFTSRALSVGEMASTLAHELNQPIGTVANVLRGIRMRIERQAMADDKATLLQGVQLALDQSLFASRIIARIREYTHSRQPRRDALDLVLVLRESLALLDWELQRDGVATELHLVDGPCPVIGDEVMLQQLFVNLLRNALEAMRDNPPGDDGQPSRKLVLRLSIERGGREAVLALRDNGCGLPEDARQRLFVPFQSTKPNGMGIGLNICRSFVELHQGRLWFSANDHEPAGGDARGCTFHVALPVSTEPTARPAPLPAPSSSPA
ncbi:sensor histidine kinase [Piscinibacter terrae]|uniref:histidine kinase n=1 Tax=Piscinibacter terrae TaxID=2496871 RepID=A0A3N7IQV6_9BURK|nr:HAMP domain-containing sensor histidine kinase [Albitalea terrae]RQP21272.1 sensor histidine kinase [Albitalea terrae]